MGSPSLKYDQVLEVRRRLDALGMALKRLTYADLIAKPEGN